MRVLLQRVSEASVSVGGEVKGSIGPGVLVLLGVGEGDGPADADWLAGKVLALRMFEDAEGRMNRSIGEAGGDALVVSQFTLHARVKKGTRPSFDRAAPPEEAVPLYERFVEALAAGLGRPVATGEFGARMEVALVNDGPVTLWIDSRRRE